MSKAKRIERRTAEYWRAYRAANRERILAHEKLRRANRTPEQIDKEKARKAKYYEKKHPNRPGRGHYPHKRPLGYMTAEERAAHNAAIINQWRIDNAERVKRARVEWYSKNKAKRKLARDLWIDANYQRHLENVRRKTRRRNDKTRKTEYKPRMNRRTPEWVTSRAEAKALAAIAFQRMMNAEVSFALAVESGLTVGRFAR